MTVIVPHGEHLGNVFCKRNYFLSFLVFSVAFYSLCGINIVEPHNAARAPQAIHGQEVIIMMEFITDITINLAMWILIAIGLVACISIIRSAEGK